MDSQTQQPRKKPLWGTIAAKHKSRQSPPLVEVTTRLDAGDVKGGDTSGMAASLDHADSDEGA